MKKWDSAYTRGFAIAQFGGFIYQFFFFGQPESVGRSLTFRVSAYN